MFKKSMAVGCIAFAALLGAGCSEGSSDESYSVAEPEKAPGYACVPEDKDIGGYVEDGSGTATVAAALGSLSFVGTAEAKGGSYGGGGGRSSGGSSGGSRSSGSSSSGRSSSSGSGSRPGTRPAAPSRGQKGFKSEARSHGSSGKHFKAGSKKGKYYDKYKSRYSAPFLWWYVYDFSDGDEANINRWDEDDRLVCAENKSYEDG
jgi:hypothetical protein